MATDLRPPAVAGRFYPGDAAEVARAVGRLLADARAASAAPDAAPLAVLAPHAGWIYSGAIAAEALATARVPDVVVVLAPNHTGRGGPVSVWARGAFALPGGAVPVHEPLAAALLARAGVEHEPEAHRGEHAVEVLLPLLRGLRPDVRVVPVVLGPLDAVACARLAAALGQALSDVGLEPADVLLLASSDMNHFASADATEVADARALEPLLALDAAGLLATVRRHRISMCGVAPAAVAIEHVRAVGATGARLVRHGHSGHVSGDEARVVGYAGVHLGLIAPTPRRAAPGKLGSSS